MGSRGSLPPPPASEGGTSTEAGPGQMLVNCFHVLLRVRISVHLQPSWVADQGARCQAPPLPPNLPWRGGGGQDPIPYLQPPSAQGAHLRSSPGPLARLTAPSKGWVREVGRRQGTMRRPLSWAGGQEGWAEGRSASTSHCPLQTGTKFRRKTQASLNLGKKVHSERKLSQLQ